jgi:uracil-DNA glycosylase family protein
MRRVLIQPDFQEWRSQARQLLHLGYTPEQVDLEDSTLPSTAPLAFAAEDEPPAAEPVPNPHTSSQFLESARFAACHRDGLRWNLLYRLLYRMQGNRDLLKVEIDTDVLELRRMEQQVRRDLHKMHAFVRFRKIEEPKSFNPFEPEPVVAPLLEVAVTPECPADAALARATAISEAAGEHFVAWYQPDHHILALAAPFFAERFAPMRWTILTPDASVDWDPLQHQLRFGPGLPREAAPADDELEQLWRSYYSSIFNPARLNPEAMRSEMPVRYWKNLPEVADLPKLMSQAGARVTSMVHLQQNKTSAEPFLPSEHTLPALRAAMPGCRGCDLYCNATQVVPGKGAPRASLMLVGEQPGDQEDLKGEPFIGPAGGVLRKALAELGIEPTSVYMTNAVKHFKFIQRGKQRLHQNPRLSEITACRPWLAAEIEAVKPRVVLCLGASAAKSLLGGTFALMRDRGRLHPTPYADQVMATVHPSAILHARDHMHADQLYHFLKTDLTMALETAQSTLVTRVPEQADLMV